MSVLTKKPRGILEWYVQRYIAANISKENRARLFPHGNFRLPNSNIRMAFHFSDTIPWLAINDKSESQPSHHVRGYQTTPITFNTNENLDYFTVEFTPFGFRSIFRISCSELELFPIPMEAVIGKEYQMLLEELAKRSSFEDRVNFMDSYFLKKISDDMQIRKAYEIRKYILGSDSFPSVNFLANEFFMTERTMRRFFIEHFGISPKQYLKLSRFEKVSKALLKEGKKNLLEVSLDFGYYDHAHFSNDFKYFMNMTLRDFQNNIIKRGISVN